MPGSHGRSFGTDARSRIDLERIRAKIRELRGIKKVKFNREKFPVEFTIYTSTMVAIKDVAEKVNATGFHVTPLGIYEI